MNRRSFLRAAGATGLLLVMQGPAAAGIFGSKQSMDALIRQALAERKVLKFKYHGHGRVVEPHALGRVTDDRRALLGWQISGGSTSEPPPGWRTFVLAEISALKLARKTFLPRPEYRPETTQLKSVEAEVKAAQ
jgi:predicted DNA-binding transcriptional regulator YafY